MPVHKATRKSPFGPMFQPVLKTTRLVALAALPLWGLQALTAEPVHAGGGAGKPGKQLTQSGKVLTRATKQAETVGGRTLAAHIVSVHSKISEDQLLAHGGSVSKLAPAAVAARATGLSLDDVLARVQAGSKIGTIVVGSGADAAKAQMLLTAAINGMNANSRAASKGMADSDGDGTPNAEDDDVDGDGTPNGQDDDVDGDGTPNSQDDDVDDDGMSNAEDDDVDGDDDANEDDDDVDGDGDDNGDDADDDGDSVDDDADADDDNDGTDDSSDDNGDDNGGDDDSGDDNGDDNGGDDDSGDDNGGDDDSGDDNGGDDGDDDDSGDDSGDDNGDDHGGDDGDDSGDDGDDSGDDGDGI